MDKSRPRIKVSYAKQNGIRIQKCIHESNFFPPENPDFSRREGRATDVENIHSFLPSTGAELPHPV